MASNHTRPRKKGGALKILLVLLVLMLAAAGGAFRWQSARSTAAPGRTP